MRIRNDRYVYMLTNYNTIHLCARTDMKGMCGDVIHLRKCSHLQNDSSDFRDSKSIKND